jgi:hypothetical protein
MGFIDNSNSSIGGTSTPNTLYASAVSENQLSIYNYNNVYFHYSLSGGSTGGVLTLSQQGCFYNGQPMWTFEDGVYNNSGAIGVSDPCGSKSHQLRYGGMGSQGSWELVTHGFIHSFTTNNSLNMFLTQGSGTTGWNSYSASTDNFPYGRFRLGSDVYSATTITAITTTGTIL